MKKSQEVSGMLPHANILNADNFNCIMITVSFKTKFRFPRNFHDYYKKRIFVLRFEF